MNQNEDHVVVAADGAWFQTADVGVAGLRVSPKPVDPTLGRSW